MPPEKPTQPKHSTDSCCSFSLGSNLESMDLNIISVHGMVCWQCIMPCSIIHPPSQSSSLCFWTRVITTGHAMLWDALRQQKCLQSSSQLKSIVHQDINCKTGNIALVQRLPPGTHKTDGFISTQPFTSALQLGRSTSKFPAVFAKQFYSCLSEIKAPSLGCALHFYSD